MADRKYKAIIDAIGKQIAAIFLSDANDVISLTDIAKHKSNDPTAAIRNGLHNKNVIAFHGLWEQLNNSWFTPPLEFEMLRKDEMSSCGQSTLCEKAALCDRPSDFILHVSCTHQRRAVFFHSAHRNPLQRPRLGGHCLLFCTDN